MRKFQDSIKALQADIDHANAMASEFLRDYDGSVIQMRVAYSAVAHFLLQWTDCKLAGALGLLKVMLYKVCADGSSALPDWEMEASIREFYGVIFPSLLQLPSGITELDDRKQRKLCLKKFRSRDEQLSEVDTERELECGICLEVSPKEREIEVLPLLSRLPGGGEAGQPVDIHRRQRRGGHGYLD
ncbi:RING/U-box superfamily protein [Zea mays]|uniref:RING/U-box superfamily protein n=1 Tax=Zea mays TaxID=4577 RepID=A0A1D6KUE4_MAIZE|nr:RING/U-box superfamily protein [Zea mays]